MPDIKIEDLPVVVGIPVSGSLLPTITDPSGTPTARKMTLAQLASFTGDTLGNVSSASQQVAANSTAYLVGSDIAVPAGGLRVGTVFKWKLVLTKTAAGTAANTFAVRVGTAGTTADTARVSMDTGTGTAAVDAGQIDISVVVRGPLSGSGIMHGMLTLWHELAATGLHNKATRVHHVASAAFDVTVANLIVGLSCQTAASTVLTFEQVVVEAKNL